jgi:inner membrane protein
LDNITHTLVGALLGETVARNAPTVAIRREADVRRAMFLSVMIVGSNLPDSDLLYSIGADDKLRYLLEHRGHTHTVVGALLLSALMLVVCWLWQRVRGTRLDARDRVWLIALAVLAPLLHIGMDALNSYGVHAWWPFDNRWFYGDSLFIVEPLFWAAAAPLVLLLRSYAARGLVALALLAGLYLAVATGTVGVGSIVLYCALAVMMLAIAWKAPPRPALVVAISLCVLITVTFAIARRQAGAALDSYTADHAPSWKTVDRVLTPMPMNPLCWEVILVQAEEDRYALRRAIASIVPSMQCPAASMGGPIAAPVTPVALPDTPFIHWHGEVLASRDQLRALASTSCEVAAFLRFARAPWFSLEDPRKVIGDLRYDRERGLGFAELDLTRSSRCPSYVPPWIPPRRDLIER